MLRIFGAAASYTHPYKPVILTAYHTNNMERKEQVKITIQAAQSTISVPGWPRGECR